VAYRADIEIGVRGIRYLDELQNKLTQVSKTIDQVNKQSVVVRRTIAGAASAVPMGPGGSGVTGASAQAAAFAVEKRVSEMRRAEAQAAIKSVKDRAVAENYISGVIARRLELKQQELAAEQKIRAEQQKITAEQQKQAALAGRKRLGSAASNAVIGGAFPLLFGQGAGAAIGGGLGGALGGAFGGTLGFGLSLVGTAIGQAIDDAQKLNSELKTLNSNLTTTGASSQTTAADISKLASQLGIAKDEALKLVSAFSEFSSANVREALATSFGAAGGEEAFNALAAAIDNKSTLEAIVKLRDNITDSQAKEALKQLELNGSASANVFLQQQLFALQEKQLIKRAEEVRWYERLAAAALDVFNIEAGRRALPTDPKTLGSNARVDQIRKEAQDRKKAQDKALQDTRKFLSEVARLNEQFTTKRTRTGPKPPEDRTADLQADLAAIIAIGDAEDRIRDLRFQNRSLRAIDVEAEKILADIERDRVKQLRDMNYQTEKIAVNKIAAARVAIVEKERLDKIREEEKRRADSYASVLRGVEYEIQLTNARITNTEDQAIIEQKLLDLKRDQSYLTNDQVEKYKQLLELANQRKDVEEIATLQKQITSTGAGLNAGFIGPAGAAFEQQIAAGKSVARATEIAKLTQELQLAELQAQTLETSIMGIGTAFGTAMTTGIAELVKGTTTAKQVFADFLGSIASTLLDAASQMIATYTAIGIARLFAGLSGSSSGGDSGSLVSGIRQYPLGPGGGAPGSVPFAPSVGFAEGGFVTGPTRALIGEGGESEYVIPASKMRSAMTRYAAGARGSSVISSGSSDSAGAGGTMTAAPIDVRYTVERINSVDYVTADQFQAGMRQAASQGAERGQQLALRRLQQSPSARRRVGMA